MVDNSIEKNPTKRSQSHSSNSNKHKDVLIADAVSEHMEEDEGEEYLKQRR